MSDKHTPGPWMVSEHDKNVVVPVANIRFGICTTNDENEPTPEDEANARLIAAAPELLEACKGIESTYVFLDSMTAGMEPQHMFTRKALQKVREAITKAESDRIASRESSS